jgi:hypothetical protein
VEIDTRAGRRQTALEAGAALALSPKLSADLSHRWGDIVFDDDAAFLDRSIGGSLDRAERVARLGFGYAITPLTRAVVDVQHEQTRFTHLPSRDGDGVRITSGFEFKPRALISGGLRLGMLRYRTNEASGPDFTGATAAVDLRYAGLEHTEIALAASRDLQYSIDAQSYYLQTGVTAGATRYLTERWSLSGSLSQVWLTYSHLDLPEVAAPVAVSPRPDRLSSASVGVSRRLTPLARVGFTASYVRRHAADPSGSYDGMRLFGTLALGVR